MGLAIVHAGVDLVDQFPGAGERVALDGLLRGESQVGLRGMRYGRCPASEASFGLCRCISARGAWMASRWWRRHAGRMQAKGSLRPEPKSDRRGGRRRIRRTPTVSGSHANSRCDDTSRTDAAVVREGQTSHLDLPDYPMEREARQPAIPHRCIRQPWPDSRVARCCHTRPLYINA